MVATGGLKSMKCGDDFPCIETSFRAFKWGGAARFVFSELNGSAAQFFAWPSLIADFIFSYQVPGLAKCGIITRRRSLRE
jgi:hypothetical protein